MEEQPGVTPGSFPSASLPASCFWFRIIGRIYFLHHSLGVWMEMMLTGADHGQWESGSWRKMVLYFQSEKGRFWGNGAPTLTCTHTHINAHTQRSLRYKETTNVLIPGLVCFWPLALSLLPQANFSQLDWTCPLRFNVSFIGSSICLKELSVISVFGSWKHCWGVV